MRKRKNILGIIARALSVVEILVILAFFIGEGFDPAALGAREWAGFLFMPVMLVFGLAISWKEEVLGAAISLIGITLFGIVEILNTFVIVLAVPSALFLLDGMRKGKI